MPIAGDVGGAEQALDLEPAHRAGVGVEHVSPPACP
jgi:hypothetical protein